jgi:hypothetical protein
VVSGGIVFVVSGGGVCIVSAGGAVMVVSVPVLSVVPETFFVELHADVTINIEPAKARLKINFFIGLILNLLNANIQIYEQARSIKVLKKTQKVSLFDKLSDI